MKLTVFLTVFIAMVSNVAAFSVKPVIKAGDKVPMVELDSGFPPQKVSLPTYCSDKSVILVGLPGAFTPTWSSKQIPEYLKFQDAIKETGVDTVLIYAVNDGAVMQAWASDQKVGGSIIEMMGDPTSEFTKACGMELNHPDVQAAGLFGRCKRFAMYIENSVVKYVKVSEAEDDPAGDAFPEATCAPAMIEAIKELKEIKA